MPDIEPGNNTSTKLNRLSEIARQNPKTKFTSLAHLLNVEFLTECYYELNAQAAAGIDQQTYQTYGENLQANIEDLVERLKSKRYKATDIRRVRIEKPDGGQRPLGILVLEDKIVQLTVSFRGNTRGAEQVFLGRHNFSRRKKYEKTSPE